MDSSTDNNKLKTLVVNVVRWGTNQQWRTPLNTFIPDDVQAKYKEFLPRDYHWCNFHRWVSRRLGFCLKEHVVVLAQYGLKDSRSREIKDPESWKSALKAIANGDIFVPHYTDMFFVILPARDPDPTWKKPEPDAAQATPPKSEVEIQIMEIPHTLQVYPSFQVLHPTQHNPYRPPPTALTTALTHNGDYGALDRTIIDTYLGSYNAGNTPPDWYACLEFFNINQAEHAKREALASSKGGDTRKRVPMKKLPGLSVGLFDYQLMGKTRELADRLPEGVNVMVAPARNCWPMVKDMKTKLDLKAFKIRWFHKGGEKEDVLTKADVVTCQAKITGVQGGSEPVFKYQVGAGQSGYIIVVAPELLPRLNGQFINEIKVPGAARPAKRSALMPGMILMDEFHEYTVKDGADNRTIAWLQHLKNSSLGSNLPTPLTYFVSGTPLGETLADVRPLLSVLEKEVWSKTLHPLNYATVEAFDELNSIFEKLTALQTSGELVPKSDITDYGHRLDCIFRNIMVRRLGTDQFQGRNLTDIGPLKVNITDHQLPSSLQAALQSLANETCSLATTAARSQNIPLSRFLRTKAGETTLAKLRLASTFPGITHPSGSNFSFSNTEAQFELGLSNNDITRTPYYTHIATWSASSPKLATLSSSLLTMLTDKSPIPYSSTTSKKYCIFTPLEAEAALLFGYLHLKKTQFTSFKNLKPILLHSSLSPAARQSVLDSFLTEGNAPPNVLIAPLALAGTGLNLQKAKYLAITGPAWTKRKNQQGYYRIHRVGQRQETRLGLLTGRWNPAERIVLAGFKQRLKQWFFMWVANHTIFLVIPNLVHYIWLLRDPFVSIYLTHLFWNPEKIYIHTDVAPEVVDRAQQFDTS
ncbi:hypothetical protein N0V88_005992 [Collariella sp. IMI 366227]|nr:hypothetical protein N0V88_005992 [Collariella sp. IMI 366227]